MLNGYTILRKSSAPEYSSKPQFHTPIIWSTFSSYFHQHQRKDPFIGRPPIDIQRAKYDFKYTYHKAANILKDGTDLEPSPKAIQRSQLSAQFFFEKIHAYCTKHSLNFPLENLNKCIGFLAVPKSKLVLVALSQDRNPETDQETRSKLIECLEGMNQENPEKTFELVKTPTKEQYLMVRALSTTTGLAQPTQDLVTPRTRCVEVALAVACNKLGRTRTLSPQDLSMQAFGTGVWGSKESDKPIEGFQAMIRNKKYLYQDALPVSLGKDQKGWIDPWKPCPEHCEKFLPALRALSLSGGQGSSYLEPRSDHPLPKFLNEKKTLQTENKENRSPSLG